MSRRQWLASTLLVLAAALLAWWFFATFERAEVEVTVAADAEARSNPVLAARRFLRRMGIQAESFDPLREALPEPASGQVLLLLSERRSLGAERSEALRAWTEAGGHLIVVGRPAASEGEVAEDKLLSTLGVRARAVARDEEAEPADATFAVDFEAAPRLLEVDFPVRVRLEAGRDFAVLADDLQGACLIHRRVGAGALSVLCEATPLHNSRIGEHDHAATLWWLVRLNGEPRRVLVAHRDDMPPLPEWLWVHAREAVLALATLLLAWWWLVAPRFGPPLDVPPPARRRLVEHTEACGRFLWEHGQGARLLRSARLAAEAAVRGRHPGWSAWSPRERAERVAAELGMSPDAVLRAFTAGAPRERREFTKMIRVLESVRKKA